MWFYYLILPVHCYRAKVVIFLSTADIIELLIVAVFFISFYGLITSRNIVKSIIFAVMKETAVIMFFISLGYQAGIVPPIGIEFDTYLVADPLPQALMITAVVIGVLSTAVNIIVFITLYRDFGSANWDTVKNKNTERNTC